MRKTKRRCRDGDSRSGGGPDTVFCIFSCSALVLETFQILAAVNSDIAFPAPWYLHLISLSFDTRVRFRHRNTPASAPGFLSTCSGMTCVQDNRGDRHLPHLPGEYTQAPGQAEPVHPQAAARKSGARMGNMSGPVRPGNVSRCFLKRSPGRSGDCQMHPHASLRDFLDPRKGIS